MRVSSSSRPGGAAPDWTPAATSGRTAPAKLVWMPSNPGGACAPVARHRRNHQMESVRCARAMCRRIGKGIDDLQLLDDRTGPPVRNEEWQRILMFRANVNEMNVQPIDLGDEVR